MEKNKMKRMYIGFECIFFAIECGSESFTGKNGAH